jgi:hypothetical protein
MLDEAWSVVWRQSLDVDHTEPGGRAKAARRLDRLAQEGCPFVVCLIAAGRGRLVPAQADDRALQPGSPIGYRPVTAFPADGDGRLEEVARASLPGAWASRRAARWCGRFGGSSALLPALPGVSRVGLRSAPTGLLRQTRRGGLTPPSVSSASRRTDASWRTDVSTRYEGKPRQSRGFLVYCAQYGDADPMFSAS